MNAYELAEIMEVHDGSQVWEHGLEIANMLRQQADRIAELEKQSEPVAWKIKWDDREWLFSDDADDIRMSNKHKWQSIPLYTTPQTKPEGYGKAVPLSDEEIEEIAIKNDAMNSKNVLIFPDELDVIGFARAIEAKVKGEK